MAGKKGILERLRDGAVLGDGGYILELERRGYVQAGPYTPEVAVEHPAEVVLVHPAGHRVDGRRRVGDGDLHPVAGHPDQAGAGLQVA